MKCTRKNIKVIITLYYGGWIPISGAGNWKYSLHDDGTILVKNDGMILPIAVHNLGAKSGDEAIISITYGMVDIKLKEKGEDKMDEKNFTDCDGRTGNCKIQLDLIRISSSVHYANVMSMERLMDIQKTNPFSLDIIWSGSVEIVNIRPVTQKDGTRRFVEYRFGTYIKPDNEKIGNNVVIDKTLAKMIGLDEEDRALPFKRICRKVRSITTIEHYPNDQQVIS